MQNKPSSHGEPVGSFAVQALVDSLQLSLQLPSPSGPGQGGVPCRLHTPALHVSVPLQNKPSSHGVPVWFVQVPAVPCPLHVTQSVVTPPPHAVAQQTVSTQKADWHIPLRVHAPPGESTGSHLFCGMLQ